MSTPTTAPCALRGPDGLAVIGRTLHDLRGIRFGEGEGGSTASTESSTAGTESGAAATTETGSTAAGTTTATTEKVEDLPPWAQKIITDTRSEAAKARVEAKAAADKAQQELADKLSVALGLKPDAAKDPAAALALAEQAQKDARASAIQLAVFKAAGAHQGNPDALLDSTSFLAKVNALDPTAADFGAQVSEAIKAAVAANPSLKAARAAGASTVNNAGGTGETGHITEEQLAKMTPEQIAEAYEKGQLKDLL